MWYTVVKGEQMFNEWQETDANNQITKYIICDGHILSAKLYQPYSITIGQYTAYVHNVLSFRYNVTIIKHLGDGINELAAPQKIFFSVEDSMITLKQKACRYAIEQLNELCKVEE